MKLVQNKTRITLQVPSEICRMESYHSIKRIITVKLHVTYSSTLRFSGGLSEYSGKTNNYDNNNGADNESK